jgi:hypothetical protein
MNRICIYPKDIQIITGKSERQSRNIITQIRIQNNKEKHQPVTLDEFCNYMGFKTIDVKQILK